MGRCYEFPSAGSTVRALRLVLKPQGMERDFQFSEKQHLFLLRPSVMQRPVIIALRENLSFQTVDSCTFGVLHCRWKCPADVGWPHRPVFIGANNELRELYYLLESEQHQGRVKEYAVRKNITWQFNPPLSPHLLR
ncbi:hypothetical protein KQX54_010091 [Cotesia glomerata]|uniref:Uncharacterized protein n=1 Tax=Cotesia glomerata TaxID=32391 RepID=A0AAV7HCN3_COTGL|nr:hypothetical protein KQX54_010091 [Cotesia glomerata]